MASTKYRTGDALGFSRPAWENVRDAEMGSRVRVETTFYPTTQRGVWSMDSRIMDADKEWNAKPVARQYDLWPNSTAMSFEAFLFQHTNKVARMAEQYRLDQDKATAPKQAVG